ncbi:MAG: DUF2839 domain-containing protein [Cyanobacteria bacterium P01_F01_bin.42]
MGEAKRRKEKMGERYGKEERILPWVPITKSQSRQFMDLTSRGAWWGIGLLVTSWLMIRFIGPAFGWWEVV